MATQRVARIALRCPDCGRVREFTPGVLDGAIRRGYYQDAEIDREAGTGTNRCVSCAAKVNVQKQKRRVGFAANLAAGRAALTPERRAVGLDAAHEHNRGRPKTEEHVAALSKPKQVRRGGKFWLCRWCGLLGYEYALDAGEIHKVPCRMEDMAARGVHHFDDQLPPHREGRRLSSDELMDSYEMLVRHKFRGETIASLAERFDLHRTVIERRIAAFIALIPPDDRASKELRRLRASLEHLA